MKVLTFGEKTKHCVVFLHGWGGSFESFLFFAQSLSQNFYCVVIDFADLMFGDKILTLDDFCNEVSDYLKTNGIQSASFVAHSFGGRVVARLVQRGEKIFNKIVLIDTAGLRYRRSLWYHVKVRWFKVLVALSKFGLVSQKKLASYGSSDYKCLNLNQKQTFKNIVNLDLKNAYKLIGVPTLIYWGEKDQETPIYMAKTLHKIIKNSGLIVEQGAGHFSYLKDVKKFMLVLESFLQERANKY